mgnify:FL=1
MDNLVIDSMLRLENVLNPVVKFRLPSAHDSVLSQQNTCRNSTTGVKLTIESRSLAALTLGREIKVDAIGKLININ